MRNFFKYLSYIFLLLFLNSNSFGVNCQPFMNPLLVFGSYSPTAAGNYETRTSLKIICRPEGPRGLVTIKVKTVGSSNSENFRIMKNEKNDNLKFNIYLDPNYSKLIDNNTMLLKTTGFFNTEREFEIIIYGRILPFQNVSIGSYQINLPITIEWSSGPN